MNFIYKNLFALPNLRPYTKHKKRIIPAIITGRISFFLLLYYTSNSLCWLDGGPPTKKLCQNLGVLQKVGGSGPPTLQWLRTWIRGTFCSLLGVNQTMFEWRAHRRIEPRVMRRPVVKASKTALKLCSRGTSWISQSTCLDTMMWGPLTAQLKRHTTDVRTASCQPRTILSSMTQTQSVPVV